MRKCPACLALSEDDAQSCWQCEHQFQPSSDEVRYELADAPTKPKVRRAPSAKALRIVGLVLLWLAALFTCAQTIRLGLTPGAPILLIMFTLLPVVLLVIGSVTIRSSQSATRAFGFGFLLSAGLTLAWSVSSFLFPLFVGAVTFGDVDDLVSAGIWVCGIAGLLVLTWSLAVEFGRSLPKNSWSLLALGVFALTVVIGFVIQVRPQPVLDQYSSSPEIDVGAASEQPARIIGAILVLILSLVLLYAVAVIKSAFAVLGLGLAMCLEILCPYLVAAVMSMPYALMSVTDIVWAVGVVLAVIAVVKERQVSFAQTAGSISHH